MTMKSLQEQENLLTVWQTFISCEAVAFHWFERCFTSYARCRCGRMHLQQLFFCLPSMLVLHAMEIEIENKK